MFALGRRTHPVVAVVVATLLAASAPPLRAQSSSACFNAAAETPEQHGPTDISAVTGNGGLSAALNEKATVTVLKWPSPSFYDQVKYRTMDRSEPRLGALPNEGAFLGLAWKKQQRPWAFSWLRKWRARQAFASHDNDEVVTVYRSRKHGLRVVVRDVVAARADALHRIVTVSRSPRSKVRRVRVVSFANFNPVFSKRPQDPSADWCDDEDDDDGALYNRNADAIVHARIGTDASTGEPSGAALAMGFVGASNGFHIGPDTYGGGSGEVSAYDDAGDGKLSGGEASAGPTDAAIAQNLELRRSRRATTRVIVAAAFAPNEAVSVLRDERRVSNAAVRRTKSRWWRTWLRATKLPRRGPAVVTRIAKRSLITLRQVADTDRSMMVASVATQSPYGVDRMQDGAYMNRALDEAGRTAMVADHDLAYGRLQSRLGQPPQGQPATPPGNWAPSYYADGVAAGPAPYEIDGTGLGIWTLWDHYTHTRSRSYLLQAPVYEAIQRAAHYLSDEPPSGCIDPATRLQCSAHEDRSASPRRTLVGAQAVWLGLDAAMRTAKVAGGQIALANATKWSNRRDELRDAIDRNFFDAEGCRCYTQDYKTGGTLLWPVRLVEPGSPRAHRQAVVNWRHMRRVLSGKTTVGGLEARLLLGNAHAWARTKRMRKVRRALRWVASVPTTDRTGLLGEAWMVYPPRRGSVTTMVSQPHAPSHAMFYLAALRAFGKKPYSFD